MLLAVEILALILNFKRGTWFCAFGMGALFMLLQVRARYVLALLALGALTLAAPTVRQRLAGLSGEFREGGGGRMTMWTRIAPPLVREHPWKGIGYRALTNERMRALAPTDS